MSFPPGTVRFGDIGVKPEEVRFELVPGNPERSVIHVPHMGRKDYTIGRGEKCLVRFRESYVSRVHAQVVLDEMETYPTHLV